MDGLDVPGIEAASVVSVSGFRVRKSMIHLCLCHCGTTVADVPGWLVEGSGSAATDRSRCAGSANLSPGR